MHIHSVDAARRRQRGASAIEFTLVAVPILLAGLGSIELSQWFFVKQAISLALLEAGRAGITDHARPSSIETAFERGLLPLFPPTATHTSAQRLHRALTARQASAGTVPWQIRVLAPNPAVFHDFASAGLKAAGAAGLAIIDNNYQAEQHERYLQRGWAGGRGPLSGATVFEANHLVLHLTYMHEPLVPGMRALLRVLSKASAGYRQQALAGGYLPLQQTLQLTMQSHPVAWTQANQKVLLAAQAAPTPLSSRPYPDACRGIWCPGNTKLTLPTESGLPPLGPDPPEPALPSAPRVPPPSPLGPPLASEGGNLPGAGDPACGTVVCCLQG